MPHRAGWRGSSRRREYPAAPAQPAYVPPRCRSENRLARYSARPSARSCHAGVRLRRLRKLWEIRRSRCQVDVIQGHDRGWRHRGSPVQSAVHGTSGQWPSGWAVTSVQPALTVLLHNGPFVRRSVNTCPDSTRGTSHDWRTDAGLASDPSATPALPVRGRPAFQTAAGWCDAAARSADADGAQRD